MSEEIGAAQLLKRLDYRPQFRFISPNEKMNPRRRTSFLALLALCGSLAATRAQNPAAFELLNGDRIVLLGDTLIEREQSYGHLEFLLTVHYPDRNITFRNLGWSADTPLGVSRAGFDPPEKGFDRLKEQLEAYKPTVAILGYDGGKIAQDRLVDHAIIARSDYIPRIQEAQAAISHVLRQRLEEVISLP